MDKEPKCWWYFTDDFSYFSKCHMLSKNVCVTPLYVQTNVLFLTYESIRVWVVCGWKTAYDTRMMSGKLKSGNSTENFTPFQTHFSFMMGTMKGETTMFSWSCVLSWYQEWPLIFYFHLFHLSKNNTNFKQSFFPSTSLVVTRERVCPVQQYMLL